MLGMDIMLRCCSRVEMGNSIPRFSKDSNPEGIDRNIKNKGFKETKPVGIEKTRI